MYVYLCRQSWVELLLFPLPPLIWPLLTQAPWRATVGERALIPVWLLPLKANI